MKNFDAQKTSEFINKSMQINFYKPFYKLQIWLAKSKVIRSYTGFTGKYEQDLDIKLEQVFNGIKNYDAVTVITPTTGKNTLNDAIKSVSDQSYKNIVHLIVVDCEKYKKKTKKIIKQYSSKNIKTMNLPFNTGKDGFNGHRIYAAVSYLVNTKYIIFLDEDNWFDTNHVKSMVDFLENKNLDWAYSLRKIYQENKVFVANDNCESIGSYRPYSKMPYLVDTNCYIFKRLTIIKTTQFWYHPKGVDRYFFEKISKLFPKFACSGKFTVNYRLTENRPPFPGFFKKGNTRMLKKYSNKLPWLENSRPSKLS